MPELLVLGLNHRTAPVSIREKVSFSRESLTGACQKLLRLPYVEEALILSTCNRTEFLTALSDLDQGRSLLINFLAGEKGVSKDEFVHRLYTYISFDAVDHVFRVASGLDSMVLGEPQITSQLKDAYQAASRAGACKRILNALLQQALKCAKIIRSQTGISSNTVSVGHSAVELTKKILGDLEERTGLLVGAGEMSELASFHLKKHGIRAINVINRTYEKAVELACKFSGKPYSLEELPEALVQSDVVISSTGAPEPLIRAPLVKEVMKARKQRAMFFIDIAVPRDVEEEVSSIPEVYLYDIDDLKEVVEANLAKRRSEAHKADRLIDEQVARFHGWVKRQDIHPVIRSLREKAELIRKTELEKSIKKLKPSELQEKNELERLSSALVNKILHEPIVTLKKYSQDETKKKKYIKVFKDFFNLE